MSEIKSERAREYTLRHLDNSKTVVNIHHVYSAISIAEQDMRNKAIKAYCNCCKEDGIGKEINCVQDSEECPFMQRFVKFLEE